MNKTKNKELKRFKFPIDLIEFPIKYSKEVIPKKDDEGKNVLEMYLKGRYGPYKISTPRQCKLMDKRTLLATLNLADYHKDRFFTDKFIDWLDILKYPDSKFYRKSILEGLEYLSDTKFYTPYLYDTETQSRENFKAKYDGSIDWRNLPSFSVWGIINEYHHLREESKRKTKIDLEIGKTFYERIFKDKYFTLIDFKKAIALKDIALNLYLFVNRQDPEYIENFPIDFNLLKTHIGITSKNVTDARKIFDKAFKDIKDNGLLSDYNFQIKEGLIWFYIKKSLEKSVDN